MAWIEAHQKLKDDPKMLLVADAMGWDDDQCIGKLFRFWWWCVDHAPNGDLRQFNDGIIARQVGLNPEQGRRFIDAMTTKVGGQSFIEREPYFRVSNWWKFIGRFLKIKYKDTPEKWKAVQDAYKGEDLPDIGTSGVTVPVTDSATRTTNQTNQPTKPNQPDQENPLPPSGDAFRDSFDEARQSYPGTRGGLTVEWANFQKKYKKAIAEIVPKLLPAIKNEAEHKRKMKEQGQFVPAWKNFSTWINNRCWEQELGDTGTAKSGDWGAKPKTERRAGEYAERITL